MRRFRCDLARTPVSIVGFPNCPPSNWWWITFAGGIVAAQPYPLLFATNSGAHLYGFPSPDSDYDLRGAHVLPLDAVVGLEVRDETVQQEMILPPDTSQGRARHCTFSRHR